MKRLVAGLLGLALAPSAFAQTSALPATLGPAGEPTPAVLGSPLGGEACAAFNDCERPVYRMWGGAEYLLWHIKDGPIPPLVTTGNPADPVPGALGQPGTQTLLGNSALGYGLQSGARFTLGTWLHSSDDAVGVEVSAFFLQRGTTNFATSSDANGNPALYVPVINRTPTSANFNNEGSIAIADVLNAGIIGNTLVVTSTRLWGTEVNGVFKVARSGGMSVDGILGFRYMDLQENLTVYVNSLDITGAGINQASIDGFNTRNQFYGGQIGARVGFQRDNWSLEIAGQLALGDTHQKVDVQGSSNYSGPAFPLAPGTYPGGLLTQPTNIGQQNGDRFGVIPEIRLKAGWQMTNWAKLTVGYDFLYWNNVVRPGNQIDRNVNFTQVLGAQPFFGAPIPPNVPASQFNQSSFFAHGVSFGLEFSF